MRMWTLPVVLAVLLVASDAEAFSRITLSPATFSEREAGISITFETRHAGIEYATWLLWPERTPPQSPPITLPVLFAVAGPPGSTQRYLPQINLALELPLRTWQGQWKGQVWAATILGSAGRTTMQFIFPTADLRAAREAGIEAFAVLAGAIVGNRVRGELVEVTLESILGAPQHNLIIQPARQPPEEKRTDL